jgi:hypothetical protein
MKFLFLKNAKKYISTQKTNDFFSNKKMYFALFFINEQFIKDEYFNLLARNMMKFNFKLTSIIGSYVLFQAKEFSEVDNLFENEAEKKMFKGIIFSREAHYANIGTGNVYRLSPIFSLEKGHLETLAKIEFGQIRQI